MSKLNLFVAILLSSVSLAAFGQKTPAIHRITEEEAIDRVMSLPEVRESNAYIRRHTKDKRKLFPMTYGEPSKEHPYWWIAVGGDKRMAFVTHFGFFVYVKTGGSGT